MDFGARDQKFSFKKPWLFDEYEKMQSTTDEAEIYLGSGVVTVESQFKKPYNALDHPYSENIFEGPPGTGVQPKINWGLPGQDCTPTGTGIGGGALNPCQPEISCGQWSWTCAHRITKFGVVQNNGFIQSIQYGKNDTVTVTVCWNEGGSSDATMKGTMVQTADGGVFQSAARLDCAGPGHNPACVNCTTCTQAAYPPILSYTTQQMSTGGTQSLSAGGGAGGPYTWTILSGGGTISVKTTAWGQSTLYTAPASNANCANNPTIQVKDFCGHTATLKIAVNASSGSSVATTYCFGTIGAQCSCQWTGNRNNYGCDNSFLGVTNLGGCNCCPACSNCLGGQCGGFCTETSVSCITGCGPSHVYVDARTQAMINQGCCPARLL